jgi:hypothetical protein
LDRLAECYRHIETRKIRKSPLHALGYSVGRNKSLSTERRRAILSFVFENPLPDVASNMAAWGEPRSTQRRHQIAQTIFRLMERNAYEPSHERACAEWAADRDFVLSDSFIAREIPTIS